MARETPILEAAMLLDVVDVHKKHWLVPLLREVVAGFDVARAREAVAPYLERAREARWGAWLDGALRRHGLLASSRQQLAPPAELPDKRRAAWFFVETLRRQLELLLELRLLLGLELDGLGDQLQLLMVLAAHAGEVDAADQLFGLDDWGPPGDPRRDALARAMGAPMKAVAAALVGGALQQTDQPLLGLPFHQCLAYVDACQLVAIGHAAFLAGGRLDHHALEPQLARGRLEKIHLIEAIFALMHADGVVTRLEWRFVENVIALARLRSDEAEMIRAGATEPVAAAQLAARIADPQTRRFAFQSVLVHAQLDGEVDAAEDAFIDALAGAFGIGPDDRLALEAEALLQLEANPAAIAAFSLGGVVRRMQSRLSDRVERVVRTNLGRLVTEIRETGDLARLLAKRTRGELDPDEERRVRAQIIDICKTVPALAIFAVPGGSILLPILMKLLPFDLMPSAFTEKDEAL